MLTFCVTLTNSLHSQTTTIENSKLRDAAKLIEKGKICEERVVLLNEKISLLNQRIAFKDSIQLAYIVKDTASNQLHASFKAEIANLKEQRDIATKEMNNQNKLLKRAKRKTVFGIVGTAGVAAALFIFVK